MSLRIDSLRVSLGGRDVLSNVSLEVAAGERVAVMGASGAGKSTLLRAVAGLVRPDAGSIAVDGTEMHGVPPHRRPVGLMFQDYALFPHMDVRSNVAYGLRMQSVPKDQSTAMADELLDLVGMTAHRDRLPGTLSGGEQQRVALARTLAPRPSVVLFDEPLGSLDVGLKEGLLHEMRTIVDDLAIASVYVTHDRDEALAFGQRLAVLSAGRIIRDGTPEELWNDPGTPLVARTIGHRAVVDGTAIGLPEGMVAVPIEAVSLDVASNVAGVVRGCAFESGTYRLTVEVDGATLETRSESPRADGDEIGLTVDRSRIVRLDDPHG